MFQSRGKEMSRGCSMENGCLGCTVQPDPWSDTPEAYRASLCIIRGDNIFNRIATRSSCPTEAEPSALWTFDWGPRLGGDSYQPDMYLQFIVLDRNRAQGDTCWSLCQDISAETQTVGGKSWALWETRKINAFDSRAGSEALPLKWRDSMLSDTSDTFIFKNWVYNTMWYKNTTNSLHLLLSQLCGISKPKNNASKDFVAPWCRDATKARPMHTPHCWHGLVIAWILAVPKGSYVLEVWSPV